MIQAGLGISTSQGPREAAREAASLALARCGDDRPGLALLVVTAAHGRSVPEVVARARDVLSPVPLVGASVEGIVAPGVELCDWPAVMVLAVAGAEACPFFLPDHSGAATKGGGPDGGHLADEVAARVGGDLAESDLVVMLADPRGQDARALASSAAGLRPATVVGGGAAATTRGSAWLWHDTDLASTGVVGLVLRGVRSRVVIAPAGRTLTAPMKVTRARGNWVLGLDGRPALPVLEESTRRWREERRDQHAPPLLVGLLPATGGDGQAVVVRNVAGVDRARQAFSVPEPMVSGQRVALVALDADAARSDFPRRLAAEGDPRPALGLYLNCRARGAALFGEAGVEARCLENAFADLPIAGLVGPFQLAPLQAGAGPALLGYAGALALIDEWVDEGDRSR